MEKKSDNYPQTEKEIIDEILAESERRWAEYYPHISFQKVIGKFVTEDKLLKMLDAYKEMLYNDNKVSPTKFDNMQVAIFGCKQLIRDAFGTPRIIEIALFK